MKHTGEDVLDMRARHKDLDGRIATLETSQSSQRGAISMALSIASLVGFLIMAAITFLHDK